MAVVRCAFVVLLSSLTSLVGARTSTGSSDPDMEAAEVYLSTVGVETGLPILSVLYGETEIAGEIPYFKQSRDTFLHNQPTIEWDASLCSGKCAVLVVDPDAPVRAADWAEGGHGALGPWLHALWTNCHTAAPAGCTAVVPYRGPSPPPNSGPHRYVFLLLSQGHASGDAVHVPSTLRKRWDLPAFLRANPAMHPRALNFFMCTHE